MKSIDTIAVLDFGGQYAHLIANRVRRLGVFTEIHSPTASVEELEGVKGIIYSGGPSSVYADDAPAYNPEILDIPVPKLGICYGHQLLASELGGKVRPGKVKEYGIADLKVLDAADPIFAGVPAESPMWMSHGDSVSELPEGYRIIASTSDCQVAAVSCPERKIYGFQFHPEVTHSQYGMKVLENFVRYCGCKKSWDMKSYLPLVTERIREEVKDRKVFLLVSGGVDSTVAFVLLNRVLGAENVLGLHIDNGMMRLGESAKVMEFLEREGMKNLRIVDASKDFLEALEGVTLPEEKRAIIGKTFLDVKDREMRALRLNPDEWMLAQGTIYPDTIESGGTKNADKIKTHHNRVSEILDLLKEGKLVEPLADLYKDEVRMLGEELRIPHALVWRHPFPGPGLGVRLLLSNGREDVRVDPVSEREVSEFATANGILGQILPVKSVGVQGDGRTYAHPYLIRNPEFSWKDCEKFATEIVNRFKTVNRVVWQVGALPGNPEPVEQFATRENFDTLRVFDNIATEFLRENHLYEKIWQMPVVMLPLRIQGKPCIVMRPVNSSEAMTANFAEIDRTLLQNLWRRFEENGAGSLWYDTTHKPPGTIEWE